MPNPHPNSRRRRPLDATQHDAHVAVQRAMAAGTLSPRPPACEACGIAGHVILHGGGWFWRGDQRIDIPKSELWSLVWHHHSYELAFHLDVSALCRKCHAKVHHGRIPEPRTGELRTGDRLSAGSRRKAAVLVRPPSMTHAEARALFAQRHIEDIPASDIARVGLP